MAWLLNIELIFRGETMFKLGNEGSQAKYKGDDEKDVLSSAKKDADQVRDALNGLLRACEGKCNFVEDKRMAGLLKAHPLGVMVVLAENSKLEELRMSQLTDAQTTDAQLEVFVKTLENCKKEATCRVSLETFDLSGVKITEKGAGLVGQALSLLNGLISLNLASIALGDEGFKKLMSAVKTQQEYVLTKFNIANIALTSQGVSFILQILTVFKKLQMLDISKNKLGNDVVIIVNNISSIGRCKLRQLDISECDIDRLPIGIIQHVAAQKKITVIGEDKQNQPSNNLLSVSRINNSNKAVSSKGSKESVSNNDTKEIRFRVKSQSKEKGTPKPDALQQLVNSHTSSLVDALTAVDRVEPRKRVLKGEGKKPKTFEGSSSHYLAASSRFYSTGEKGGDNNPPVFSSSSSSNSSSTSMPVQTNKSTSLTFDRI